jgi:hypothetical protein
MILIRHALLVAALAVTPAWGFDHQHQVWTLLLQRHVTWLSGGHESRVSYAGFQQDRQVLKRYLDSLSAVNPSEFDAWSKPQKLAFLIDAYNAYTVELILTRYPNIKSIRDFGLVFNNPWKKRFFSLLGEKRNLDDVEHGMIRARGVYDDPRVHSAVNCASIGCPALRDEAYVAERLDWQLDDQMTRFLSDHTRNRYNGRSGVLEVSKIFSWYGDDFAQGFRGWTSVKVMFAAYANLLSDDPSGQRRVRDKQAAVRYMAYDWALNSGP